MVVCLHCIIVTLSRYHRQFQPFLFLFSAIFFLFILLSLFCCFFFFIIHPARPLFRFGDFKTNTVGSRLSASLREPDKDVILLLICASFFFARSSFSHYVSSSFITRYKTGMNQRQLRNKRLMGFN